MIGSYMRKEVINHATWLVKAYRTEVDSDASKQWNFCSCTSSCLDDRLALVPAAALLKQCCAVQGEFEGLLHAADAALRCGGDLSIVLAVALRLPGLATCLSGLCGAALAEICGAELGIDTGHVAGLLGCGFGDLHGWLASGGLGAVIGFVIVGLVQGTQGGLEAGAWVVAARADISAALAFLFLAVDGVADVEDFT
jgi:hypothetical protein